MKIKKVTGTELHEMLCKGKVKFQFTKKDGSVRTAVGTLKSDLITRKPAGGENKVEGAVVVGNWEGTAQYQSRDIDGILLGSIVQGVLQALFP